MSVVTIDAKHATAGGTRVFSNGSLRLLPSVSTDIAPRTSLATEILEQIFHPIFDMNRVDKDPNYDPNFKFK
jgi:hypothetical protein